MLEQFQSLKLWPLQFQTISKFEIVNVTISNLKLWPSSPKFFSTARLELFFLKLLSFQDLTISNIGIVSNILCNNSHIGIVTTLDPMTVHNNSNLGITRGGENCFISRYWAALQGVLNLQYIYDVYFSGGGLRPLGTDRGDCGGIQLMHNKISTVYFQPL